MSNFHRKALIKRFKEASSFSKQELYDLYSDYDPDLKDSTLRWRIHQLKEEGVIRAVKRGEYVISDKPEYVPDLSEKLIRLSSVLNKEYSELDHCIWSTEWLNEFTRHQLGSYFTILEVEKDMAEMVFEDLRYGHDLKVYMKPDETVIERHVAFEQAILLIPLISRSPLRSISIKNGKNGQVKVPALEKMLVDLFCDEKTFYAIRGAELEYIFEHAIREYSINYSKLFNYSRRRSREKEFKEFLRRSFEDQLKDILG